MDIRGGRCRWNFGPKPGGRVVGVVRARWVGGRRVRRKGWIQKPRATKDAQADIGEAKRDPGKKRHKDATLLPAWVGVAFCLLCVLLDPLFGNHVNTHVLSNRPEPGAPIRNARMINTAELVMHFDKRRKENLDYWHAHAKVQRSTDVTPEPTARRDKGRLVRARERKGCNSTMVADLKAGWPEAGGRSDANVYWKSWYKNAKHEHKSIYKRRLKVFRTVRKRMVRKSSHKSFQKLGKKTNRVAEGNVLRYWQKWKTQERAEGNKSKRQG